MNRRSLPSRQKLTAATSLAAAGLLVASLATPVAQAAAGHPSAAASTVDPPTSSPAPEPFSDKATGLADLDTRTKVQPTLTQRRAVPAGASVRWNRYGTPSSLINHAGYLSSARGGSATTIARGWLSAHRAVLGLTATRVQALQVINSVPLNQSTAHVVRFRQMYGADVPAIDGMVTVAVTPSGRVAYVSSSLSRGPAAAPAASITPLEAWSKALAELTAKHAPGIPAADLAGVVPQPVRGWQSFQVPGFAQRQQVRLRALAMPGTSTPRPVFEVNVVNNQGGSAAAYTSYVDAVTGGVLVRHNRVDNLATLPFAATNTPEAFQGSFTATTCGPNHDFTVTADAKTLVVTATALAPDEDIVLKLLYNGTPVASSDQATSPEAITYPTNGNAGTYTVQVCPFAPNPTAPVVLGKYAGTFLASDQSTPSGNLPYPPEWKYFVANPNLDYSNLDSRKIGCWTRVSGCDVPPSALQNIAARNPWDYDPRANAPTNTTIGNAAVTGEAWVSPLSPGGGHQMPISANRHYGFDNNTVPLANQDFTNAWYTSKCNPAQLTPGGNDILASVTNLFSGHNRFHDFSYFLGFTEDNYNLQNSNFGNLAQGGTVPGGGERDPEIGNVQAGALVGERGLPVTGRDNANQITLQDGTPGITNQYLFQPLPGAFYSPCVDGDFDTSVYGHEYTHAISNRMVAGPDNGLSGFQAGSMGESWSDQVALEYQFEHGYSMGTSNPWIEGPYVTGNKVTGIRNYALNQNPLQYGDLGYDTPGPEVHADGEVWSAAMFNVRRQLVAKYNATYPEADKPLQLRCADANPPNAPLPAQYCPGGRRWIQLMFDGFLMQESATSMLDARDAFLAADKLRFGGRNQAAIWQGFAQNGMGTGASTTSTDDSEPKADYTSPLASEGTLSFSALGLSRSGQVPVKGKLYVGDYEARVTPIGDTDPKTSLPSTIRMVPGTYRFVFQAPGYGLRRFTTTITAGRTTARSLHLSTNLASAASGATIDGASEGSVNTGSLIDDTEATNWAGVNPTGVSVAAPGSHPFVNVRLAGGRQVVRSVNVSAMLRPVATGNADQASNSRFTALRKFAIETCTDSATSDCSSLLSAGVAGSPYKVIYTSPDNAFNGVAPRPLAPALIFKRFDVPDTTATHVRLVALQNQCTGQSAFAGDQDADPSSNSDCNMTVKAESARAAELQVFGYDAQTRPPGDPVVLMTMTGSKAVAKPGDTVTYTMTYRNLGPKPASNADIRMIDTTRLPAELQFVSASGGGRYDRVSRALRWSLGTVAVGATKSVTLTTRVAPTAPVGPILVQAQFAGTSTFSPPAAAVTVVGR